MAVCLSSGCVSRRLTIRSNPPGAKVYIDNYEIGTTPVSTSYIYYGSREIRLVRDGYETQVAFVNIPPPWYDVPGVDLISEHVIPWEIRDERTIDFTLLPQVILPTEEVLRRGEELRRTNPAAQTIVAGPGTTVCPPPFAPAAPPPGAPLPVPYSGPATPPAILPPPQRLQPVPER